MGDDEFYEDDEPLDELLAEFDAGEKGTTRRPEPTRPSPDSTRPVGPSHGSTGPEPYGPPPRPQP